MKPFVKWAGGKRQIMNYITPYVEKNLKPSGRYYEPFLGGGSVFFNLKRSNCVINDLNDELINCYRVIKENPEELIAKLKEHSDNHNKEYFYDVRSYDRDILKYREMSDVDKAARTIYLNKTCFNGLYRVNRSGYFNTPMGRYNNPNIVDEVNIKEVSSFFNNNKIIIKSTTFDKCVQDAGEGDFVYFDPPYDYEEKGFTQYVKEGFDFTDLKKLKITCDKLIERNCVVLISNNATDRVLDLFDNRNYKIVAVAKYDHQLLDVHRYIGSSSESRKLVKEVLIYGHK